MPFTKSPKGVETKRGFRGNSVLAVGIATLAVVAGPTACLSEVVGGPGGGGASGQGSIPPSAGGSLGATGGHDQAGAPDEWATAGTAGVGTVGGAGAASFGGMGTGAPGGGGTNDEAGGQGGDAGSPRELPVIAVGEDPELCPAQSYTILLTVTGGIAPYTWASDTASAAVAPASDDTARLTGLAPIAASLVSVTVTDSSGQTSAPAIVPLKIGRTGLGECPTISTTDLSAPCLGYEYKSQLINGTGGTGMLTLAALAVPDGLSFDPDRQIVTGTARVSGALTLQVTDTLNRSSQKSFFLNVREKCWLGYVSSAAGSDSQLHLFDPVLLTEAPAFELSSNNTAVSDFRFSPDGKFLVYRRSSNGGAKDLVLAASPSWAEKVFSFGDSVLEYSWSQGASVLAVAYQTGADTMLGGINVTSASLDGNGYVSGVQLLAPVAMISSLSRPLESELVWLQSDKYLAFHADASPGLPFGVDFPYYSHLDSGGFSPVNFWHGATVSQAANLLPALNGIFVADRGMSSSPELNFYGTMGDADFDQFLRDQIVTANPDPAGRYVALPLHEKLQVFSTAESGGTPDPPTPWALSDASCVSILTWDQSKERIVCDALSGDTPPVGELRIFTLADGNSIATTAVKALAGYQQGDSNGHRRIFSPQGNWLAVASDSTLYVIDLRQTPQVVQTLKFDLSPVSGPDQLAFSPDESMLLWQRGSRIAAIALQMNGPLTLINEVNDPSAAPRICNNEFQPDPKNWCGNLSVQGELVWAPNAIGFGGLSPRSRFAASLTTARGLRVYDAADLALGVGDFYACQNGCSDNFQFQP